MNKKINDRTQWFRRMIFFVIAITFFVIGGGQTVHADNPTYAIDQAPLTPPSFDDYTIIKVTNVADLTNTTTGLPASNDKVIYQLQNNIQLTSQIKIVYNKAIDLNGHTLIATSSGNLLIEQANTTTKQFKLYNGTITGGPEAATQGGNGSQTKTDTAFLNSPVANDHTNTVRDIVIEDLTYKSSDKGGSFIIALSANLFSLGTVDVSTYNTNLRAGNMTFLGDFTGTAFGNGAQDWYGQAAGGVNLSFDAQTYSYINSDNFGTVTMDQNNGDRRLYIAKDAHVNLTNTNSDSSANGRQYANNISNYAVLNVDGSLICNSQGVSLHSFAVDTPSLTGYSGRAGTFNGKANIYVNPGATFEISTLGTYTDYGLFYTYNTNIYVKAPKSFDLKYLGTSQFIYSRSGQNNLYFYNSDIDVWTKAASPDGTGNPTTVWQDVEWLQDINISGSSEGTISSSDSSITASTFKLNSYSRVATGADQPVIVSEDTINNGDTTFSGSSNYQEYGGGAINDKVAAGATVTLKIDGKTYTTTTDDQGKWTFTNLDLKKIAGATTASINLTDKAGLSAETKTITVVDTVPPEVTTQVIKVKENTTNGLNDSKAGIASAIDETTATGDLTYEYVTSYEERKAMLTKVGVHTVEIKVSDAAGNATTVSTPVIIYTGSTIPTNGFVTGNNFSVDLNTWKKASADEKRSIVIDKGAVKGYAITDTTADDVTTDATQTIVTVPDSTWEANQTYEVTFAVGDYTKTIKVTLTPSDVNMTIKQVYTGTNTAIYSDLENKTAVDNSKTTEVQIGDNMEDVINQLITDKKISLNYTGYDTQTIGNYKVYQNDVEVSPKPTTVPDSDFTLVYEYTGQLKFGDEVATNLNFGSVKITGSSSDTQLTDASDKKISIIDTLQNANWTLKAAVPNGITSDTNKVFLGSLIYKSGSSNEQVIGSAATAIESQSDDSLLSELDLKNGTDGLYLQQSGGNLKGSYSGQVVWTLEDAP